MASRGGRCLIPDESPPPEPDTLPVKHYPWCPYTAEGRTKVLRHMEAAHPQRWRDLALSPPIAGGVY